MSKRVNSRLITPYYRLWIGGNEIGLKRRRYITQISIDETDEGSDSATISISDPNMEYINDNIYVANRKVKIRIGFRGHSKTIKFNGYISNVDINFSEDNIPTLTLTCMDNTYRMNKKKVSKKFKKKTNAQIVKSICKKYGFKCVVQSDYKFKVNKEVSQSSQTDIEFIEQLAGSEIYPFTARLVGDTFYYVKQGKLSKDVKAEITYRGYPHDLISFNPQINTETRQESSGSTDTGKKKQSTSKGSSDKGNEKDNKSTTKKKSGGLKARQFRKDNKWHKK